MLLQKRYFINYRPPSSTQSRGCHYRIFLKVTCFVVILPPREYEYVWLCVKFVNLELWASALLFFFEAVTLKLEVKRTIIFSYFFLCEIYWVYFDVSLETSWSNKTSRSSIFLPLFKSPEMSQMKDQILYTHCWSFQAIFNQGLHMLGFTKPPLVLYFQVKIIERYKSVF